MPLCLAPLFLPHPLLFFPDVSCRAPEEAQNLLAQTLGEGDWLVACGHVWYKPDVHHHDSPELFGRTRTVASS